MTDLHELLKHKLIIHLNGYTIDNGTVQEIDRRLKKLDDIKKIMIHAPPDEIIIKIIKVIEQ